MNSAELKGFAVDYSLPIDGRFHLLVNGEHDPRNCPECTRAAQEGAWFFFNVSERINISDRILYFATMPSIFNGYINEVLLYKRSLL
jgi:hypothetical protein